MTDRRLLKQIIIIVILFCGCLAAQTRNPERKVEGNAITSENDPKVRIELLKSVQYVGADRWVLYGIADCELHAFVEADQRKNVQSLYWVQFEDLAPTGFSAAELQKGGKAYDRWPAIEKDLIERAEQKIAIAKTAKP